MPTPAGIEPNTSHFQIRKWDIFLFYAAAVLPSLNTSHILSDLTLPPTEKMKKKLDVVGKEFLQAVYSEGKSTV